MRRSRRPGPGAGLLSLAVILAACGGDRESADAPEQEETAAPATITVAEAGFATPESVLHDEATDVYLVSNINGGPADKDDNGFISRLSPDGEVLELMWIDGSSEGVTLNAPKGLALQGGTLYVADIDCIRMFDGTTGAPAGETCVEGATFLNDVAAAPDGSVVFTDSGLDAAFAPTGADAVYRLRDGEVTVVVEGAGLGAPNGVVATRDGIVVVTFMSGEVFRLDAEGSREQLMETSGLQLDGVVALPDGRLLLSSWADSCVYSMGADGTTACVVEGVEAPADIGFDRTRNRVLVPLFNANAVRIQGIG
ncbi:MAG TPA: hypothetical protein VK849_05485 [Longimicrobiales bacterium]|nr:hypothetical protein [Longimicrobiales bacterium]